MVTAALSRKIAVYFDRGFFLVMALGGAALIVLLRVADFAEDQSSWFAMTVAISLMVIYFSCVIVVERFRLRLDQAGDNMYYLGFIYTLSSLAVALYQFQAGVKASHYIASNFGVALASTIVGVAARVLLHQMREDPVDVERESRNQLSQAAAELRTEMEDTVLQFNSFRRATLQSIEEGLREIGDAALGVLKDSAAEYKAATDEAISGIQGAFATFKAESRSLNRSARQLNGSLEKLVERVDAIQVSPDLVSRTLAPLSKELAKVVSDLGKLAEAQGTQASVLLERIGSVGAGVERLTDSTNDAATALQNFAEEGFQRHQGAVAAFAAELERFGDVTKATAESHRQLSTAVAETTRRSHEVLEAQSVRLGESSEKLNDEQQKVLEAMREASLQFAAQLTEQQEALSHALSAQVLEVLNEAREHREALNNELAAARTATTELSQALISLANTVTGELRRHGQEL